MDNNLKIVGPAMSDLPWKIVLLAAVFPQPCRLGAFIGLPFWGEPCQ